LKKENKAGIFIDTKDTAHVFFKYKGQLIDTSELFLNEACKAKTVAECQE